MKVLLKIVLVILGILALFMPFYVISSIFSHSFDIYTLILYLISGGIVFLLLRGAATEGHPLDSKLGTIITMMWFFPAGLYILWKKSNNKKVNSIITGAIALFLIFGLATYKEKPPEDTEVSADRGIVEETTEEPTKDTETTAITTTNETTTTSEQTTTTSTTTTETITTSTYTTTAVITTAKPTPVPPTEAPTERPTPAPTTAPPPVIQQSNERDYVLNTSTKKFHYPNCPSVSKINAENREDVHATRDDVISWGYDSCGKCHP